MTSILRLGILVCIGYLATEIVTSTSLEPTDRKLRHMRSRHARRSTERKRATRRANTSSQNRNARHGHAEAVRNRTTCISVILYRVAMCILLKMVHVQYMYICTDDFISSFKANVIQSCNERESNQQKSDAA